MAAKKKIEVLENVNQNDITHQDLLDALAVIAVKLDGVLMIIDKILKVMDKVDGEIDKKNGK